MKSSGKRRPIEYLNPDLNAERIARMWAVIEIRQKAYRPSTKHTAWYAFACACAALACLFVVLHWPRGRAPEAVADAATGDVIVTSDKSTSLNLPDGSALVLSEAAKLAVVSATPSDVRLHLERGRVACEVTHREGRHFTVEALGISVQVKGTHFTVEVAGKHLTVRVERGVVEVRDRAQLLLATMTAGQAWSGPEITGSLVTPPVESAEPMPAPSPAPPPSATLPALDADALFEQANAARIAGRAAQAAADYDRFRAHFPADARAGLAAFELGRIRLDSLHDARRALAALRFALSHNRGGFAAEDAEALQVDALQRLPDHAACLAARAAFLSAHPGSAHTARVSRACPDG